MEHSIAESLTYTEDLSESFMWLILGCHQTPSSQSVKQTNINELSIFIFFWRDIGEMQVIIHHKWRQGCGIGHKQLHALCDNLLRGSFDAHIHTRTFWILHPVKVAFSWVMTTFSQLGGGCLWIKKWMQTFVLYPSCEWGPWSQLLYLRDQHEVKIFTPTKRLT